MEIFRCFGPVHDGTSQEWLLRQSAFLRYPGSIALNSGTTFFETPAIHPGSRTRQLSRRMTDDVYLFFGLFFLSCSKYIIAGSGSHSISENKTSYSHTFGEKKYYTQDDGRRHHLILLVHLFGVNFLRTLILFLVHEKKFCSLRGAYRKGILVRTRIYDIRYGRHNSYLMGPRLLRQLRWERKDWVVRARRGKS
ncbi:hypothetical protein QBC36DRAFT_88612 [Triangularia setosa]|uniref:Uncharacterized protein n=1 Tax=Triangularia setosa TaxID=2587417 RepID=A0AAN6WED5_9PEZI|nr:hypothetical protein QBC36DRAFT_88612 [Podospora setosa]